MIGFDTNSLDALLVDDVGEIETCRCMKATYQSDVEGMSLFYGDACLSELDRVWHQLALR